MTSASTRPGTATISLTTAYAVRVRGRGARRGRRSVATVGTTNASATFSPASSGRVRIFTIASRAEFAWIEHMPGSPEFKAIRRSRHSSCPHLPDDDPVGAHAQRLLDQAAQLDLTGALEVGLPGLHRHDVGQRDLELEDLLTLTTRSRPGTATARQLSMVVLPACVPPATRTFRPARTDASRKRAACGVRLPRPPGRRAGAPQHELADVDRREAAADPLEDDVQPVALGQHRVDERRARSSRRPLDLSIRSTSSWTCAASRREVGQLVPTVAGDEDPAGVVDPDLLDLRVVEEGLQRPEARTPGRPARRPSRRRRRPGRPRRSGCARRGRARRPRRCGVRRAPRAAGRHPRGGRARAPGRRGARPGRRGRPPSECRPIDRRRSTAMVPPFPRTCTVGRYPAPTPENRGLAKVVDN